jgi:hypothetical protein
MRLKLIFGMLLFCRGGVATGEDGRHAERYGRNVHGAGLLDTNVPGVLTGEALVERELGH